MRSATIAGQRSRSNGNGAAKPGGATSRMTVAGNRVASHGAGASAGGASGGHGKAQPPLAGHHLLPVRRRAVDDAIIAGVLGISAKKLLCESREIEIGSSVRIRLVPIVHRAPHRKGAQHRHRWMHRIFQQFEGSISRNREGPPDKSGGPERVSRCCAVTDGSTPGRTRLRHSRRVARRSARRSWGRRA